MHSAQWSLVSARVRTRDSLFRPVFTIAVEDTNTKQLAAQAGTVRHTRDPGTVMCKPGNGEDSVHSRLGNRLTRSRGGGALRRGSCSARSRAVLAGSTGWRCTAAAPWPGRCCSTGLGRSGRRARRPDRWCRPAGRARPCVTMTPRRTRAGRSGPRPRDPVAPVPPAPAHRGGDDGSSSSKGMDGGKRTCQVGAAAHRPRRTSTAIPVSPPLT